MFVTSVINLVQAIIYAVVAVLAVGLIGYIIGRLKK